MNVAAFPQLTVSDTEWNVLFEQKQKHATYTAITNEVYLGMVYTYNR